MIKVLIVEDEAEMQENCVRILRRHGYACLSARSGREAFALMEAERPELVLTDIHLGEVNGIEVARKAMQASPPISVVVMSAYGTAAVRETARGTSVMVFLQKPFSMKELVEAVELALSRPPVKET